MKQIAKCPHCRRDTMFSHSICPNCGRSSHPGERLAPDYAGGGNGLPNYAYSMEEELTVTQRHGAIQLAVSLGLLCFPACCCFATSFFLQSDAHRTIELPVFKSLLACVLLGWGSWEVWFGRRGWLRAALSVFGLATGVLLISAGIFSETEPLFRFAGVLFGVMHGAGGWLLWKGRDIRDFLNRPVEPASGG